MGERAAWRPPPLPPGTSAPPAPPPPSHSYAVRKRERERDRETERERQRERESALTDDAALRGRRTLLVKPHSERQRDSAREMRGCVLLLLLGTLAAESVLAQVCDLSLSLSFSRALPIAPSLFSLSLSLSDLAVAGGSIRSPSGRPAIPTHAPAPASASHTSAIGSTTRVTTPARARISRSKSATPSQPMSWRRCRRRAPRQKQSC